MAAQSTEPSTGQIVTGTVVLLVILGAVIGAASGSSKSAAPAPQPAVAPTQSCGDAMAGFVASFYDEHGRYPSGTDVTEFRMGNSACYGK